jgi:hypothetical protein
VVETEEEKKAAACENCKQLSAGWEREKSQWESERNTLVYLIIAGGGFLILALIFY